MEDNIYLPLALADLHLGFAFPFVSEILLMFASGNTALSILVQEKTGTKYQGGSVFPGGHVEAGESHSEHERTFTDF